MLIIEKDAMRARNAHARQVVTDLNNGAREWLMSIPARPDVDPDLIIGASLHDVDTLLTYVEQLERERDAALARLGAMKLEAQL